MNTTIKYSENTTFIARAEKIDENTDSWEQRTGGTKWSKKKIELKKALINNEYFICEIVCVGRAVLEI